MVISIWFVVLALVLVGVIVWLAILTWKWSGSSKKFHTNTGCPGELRSFVVLSETGTFEVPHGVKTVFVELWGGGGGGGSIMSPPLTAGGGGGAGGYVFSPVAVRAGDVFTCVIGSGGVGGATIGTDGSAGFNTTVFSPTANHGSGVSMVANGGAGGTASSEGGGGGGASGALSGGFNSAGSSGTAGIPFVGGIAVGGAGGAATSGGGGGRGASVNEGSEPGSLPGGGGGGGGGSISNFVGNAGAPGLVRFVYSAPAF
jgi:hypothetical protein